jgi:hypothetical protein
MPFFSYKKLITDLLYSEFNSLQNITASSITSTPFGRIEFSNLFSLTVEYSYLRLFLISESSSSSFFMGVSNALLLAMLDLEIELYPNTCSPELG